MKNCTLNFLGILFYKKMAKDGMKTYNSLPTGVTNVRKKYILHILK